MLRRRPLIVLALLALAACGVPLPGADNSAGRPVVSLYRPTPTHASAPAPSAAGPTPTLAVTAEEPTAPPQEEPWRFVVLGDTRTSGLLPPDMTYQIIERARTAEPDVVVAVGDLIKAMADQESVRQQWRNWREAIAPLGAEHLLVTPGNHDVEGNAWATDLMAEAFPELPENGPAGLERLAYSVDYRGVRFISLHSEIYGDAHRLGEGQLAWLEGQLSDNPNRWTIVFSHDPAFPIGPHIGSALDVYPSERDALWALLARHRVTAYFAGHEHLYNRQEIDGVPQIIAGTSGSYIYQGYGGEFYHYVVAEVGAEGIAVTVHDHDGVERDRFTLSSRAL